MPGWRRRGGQLPCGQSGAGRSCAGRNGAGWRRAGKWAGIGRNRDAAGIRAVGRGGTVPCCDDSRRKSGVRVAGQMTGHGQRGEISCPAHRRRMRSARGGARRRQGARTSPRQRIAGFLGRAGPHGPGRGGAGMAHGARLPEGRRCSGMRDAGLQGHGAGAFGSRWQAGRERAGGQGRHQVRNCGSPGKLGEFLRAVVGPGRGRTDGPGARHIPARFRSHGRRGQNRGRSGSQRWIGATLVPRGVQQLGKRSRTAWQVRFRRTGTGQGPGRWGRAGIKKVGHPFAVAGTRRTDEQLPCQTAPGMFGTRQERRAGSPAIAWPGRTGAPRNSSAAQGRKLRGQSLQGCAATAPENPARQELPVAIPRGRYAPGARDAPVPRWPAWRSDGLQAAAGRSARRSPRNSRTCPRRSAATPRRSC